MGTPAQAPTTVDLLVVLTRVETKLDSAGAGLADHEQRLRTLEQAAVTSTELAPLRSDVESLKRARWPLPALGALCGIGGLVSVWWQSTGR
ncbi:hypothetical protein [Streptacidiphilus sp. EB103A]|uniref:hypothetical protein n=1 Tax=Streptacidiphilus sp. EB103A TaxID=3156275 RepID=UPI003519A35C